MINLIIPTLALLLAFLASLASLRHLLSRQGIYWLIPVLISFILFYQNIVTLLKAAEDVEAYIISFQSLLPLVLAILWYAMIQAFHFALKTEREYNKYADQSRKTYHEARFILLTEKRKTKKEMEEKRTIVRNKPVEPSIPVYNFPDKDN